MLQLGNTYLIQKKAVAEEQRKKNKYEIWKTKNKRADVIPIISMITLNVNRASNPVKRQNYQTGLKKHETQLHAVFRGHALDSKIQTD